MTSNPPGLNKKEVEKLRTEFGWNELPPDNQKKWLQRLIHQFTSPLIYILFGAAVLTALLVDWHEAIAILVVVVVNAVVGFIQETRAENTTAALAKMIKSEAKVWREGNLQIVTARELVPGDLVALEAGDVVPADGKILEAKNLEVSQAQLTGEPYPMEKKTGAEIFQSSPVHTGKALMEVTKIGAATEIGQINRTMNEQAGERTPLEKQIADLTKKIIWLALISALLFIIIGVIRGLELLEMLEMAVILAVSTVPEGLPIVLTVALAIGMQRMSKAKAVMKNLPSTSTLAGVDVIATDKTGTITEGNLILRDMTDLAEIKKDNILTKLEKLADRQIQVADRSQFLELSPQQKLILEYGVLANEAVFEKGKSEIGDPLDLAILKFAGAQDISLTQKKILTQKWQLKRELPFDSAWRMMGVVAKNRQSDEEILIVKGAPEEIMAKCNFKEAQDRKIVASYVKQLNERGLRTIALAKRKWRPSDEKAANEQGDESNLALEEIKELEFAGVYEFIDPLRKGVKKSVAEINASGVRVIMITGDHLATAKYIATQAGIFSDERADRALLGEDLEKMSAQELSKTLNVSSEKGGVVSVVARATPKTKMLILKTLQKAGRVVAMTGDGVNDGPALAAADIGVAMGITGTEVAKTAADMILTADNFNNLVQGINQARVVFDNLRKVITFLISTSLMEILLLLLATAFNLPLPLLAIQILWLNLVTDGFLDFSLGSEPEEGEVLNRHPEDYQGEIMRRRNLIQLGFLGGVMLILLVGLYVFWSWRLGLDLAAEENLGWMRTMFVISSAMLQWFNVVNCRSESKSIFKLGLKKNKVLLGALVLVLGLQTWAIYGGELAESFLKTQAVGIEVWLGAGIAGIILIGLEEGRKWCSRRDI